jgi:hypothetical protein
LGLRAGLDSLATITVQNLGWQLSWSHTFPAPDLQALVLTSHSLHKMFSNELYSVYLLIFASCGDSFCSDEWQNSLSRRSKGSDKTVEWLSGSCGTLN